MTPDTPLSDALTRLQEAPRGAAIYVREQTADGSWETVWVVRDEARWLASLGQAPAVEFRAGAFDEGGVVVLPILLHLGAEAPARIYATWMNGYQVEGENVYLEDLARQEDIRIHLCDDTNQVVRTLTVPNRLRDIAITVLERQASYQPSTMAAFEYACQRLFANYADVHALWQALGPC